MVKKYIKKVHKNLIASVDKAIDSVHCLKRLLEITKIRDHRERNAKLRTVFVNHERPEDYNGPEPLNYCNNEIITSKYTLFTFLPKNLFEQFRRIANFYFLINAIIMFVIPDPPFDPFSNALPFMIVIVVTAIKQAYEDILRHKADNRENKKSVRIIRNGKLVKITSKNIRCGDIVQVERDSMFPCDLVLLHSTAESETCHIQTANLDGETNLKIRYIPNKFPRINENSVEEELSRISSLRGVINCEKPNTRLYEFRGKITLPNGLDVGINNDNILLRGQNLKIAPVIYGCAIYTGKNTKVMLNSKFKANKLSCVERRLNTFVLVFIVILILLTLICLVGSIYFEDNMIYTKHWYLNGREPAFYNSNRNLTRFITFIFFMNINYLVPLSMYVTVELQRFFGSEFFQWDLAMYDQETNEPAKVNSSDLNEDLGQIEYLFSDKTGTLTENEMVFKHFAINGIVYEERGGRVYAMDADEPTSYMGNTDLTRLLEGLSLCHTVQLDHTSKEIYNASSPDELSFIKYCLKLGIVFEGDQLIRNQDNIQRRISYTINGYKIIKNYELIEVLEFDSSRKCMSVIIRHCETNEYILYTKGADVAMFKKAKQLTDSERATFEKSLSQFSLQGWRTLVFGYKLLTQHEFRDFSLKLEAARNDVLQREQKLAAVYELIERDLVLNGVTAVEDKLQEDVAKTLRELRLAGIKIWVLTGDKLETAVNISESCGHFSNSMVKFSLSDFKSSQELSETLSNIGEEMGKGGAEPFALVIDGETLSYVFEMNFGERFRLVAERCEAVLCCRMSPSQKAEIVKLIKSSKCKPMTAAIGDGANDVSMIQEAHVGVGIFGKEGRSAALSADFAFAKFKFLRRALLVHGYLYYTRVAMLVLYFFYKNFLFVICNFYYAWSNAFSAGSVFNTLYQAIFNLALTTIPIFILGIVDQKTCIAKLEKNPKYYRSISRNALLSAYEFAKWTLLGIWHSFNCYFMPFLLFYFNNSNLNSQGLNEGGSHLGSLTIFLIFLIAHIKVFLIWQNQTVIALLAYAASLIAFSLSYFVSNAFIASPPFTAFTQDQDLYWACYQILSIPLIWFLILLCTVFALIPDIIMKCVEDMEFSRKLLPGKLSQYVKKTKQQYNNQIRSHIKKPSQVSDISAASTSEKERKASIDIKMFQSDKSVLSSNNVYIAGNNYETSSF